MITLDMNGKTYRVSGFDGERATSIMVKTKTGWRTLGGYGRAKSRA